MKQDTVILPGYDKHFWGPFHEKGDKPYTIEQVEQNTLYDCYCKLMYQAGKEYMSIFSLDKIVREKKFENFCKEQFTLRISSDLVNRFFTNYPRFSHGDWGSISEYT